MRFVACEPLTSSFQHPTAGGLAGSSSRGSESLQFFPTDLPVAIALREDDESWLLGLRLHVGVVRVEDAKSSLQGEERSVRSDAQAHTRVCECE